ncbi:MAG: tripartite tricarboxylate transporter family receptor [Hyphomicrobiales bacterium]|nr:tripartite tricarboxylate transporter family receptor [Hyphomicrobiales bacterium]
MRSFASIKVAIAVAVATFSSSGSRSETPAEFYRGKDVRLLISHPAGGGYDTYARLFARHLSKFLDGQPNVIPQNMPGAAGIVMANSMGVQERNDGTVIGLGPGSIGVADLFKLPNVRYSANAVVVDWKFERGRGCDSVMEDIRRENGRGSV